MSEINDQLYEVSFMLAIGKVMHRPVGSCREAFELWRGLQERQKSGLWEEVGIQSGMTAKQAHDRWHNRFSRQFYDDINLYKPFLKKLITIFAGKKSASGIIEEFYRAYPTVQLHPQTLFQHVTYQLRVHGARAGKPSDQEPDAKSTMSKDTYEGPSICEKTDTGFTKNDFLRLEQILNNTTGGYSDDE